MNAISKTKFNYSLEGLRGICAIVVALGHVFSGFTLLKYNSSLFSYFNFGHIAVLIFFVLSGYVIGINYPAESFNKRDYLLKRFIRIYPIYFLTVIICLIFEPRLNLELVLSQIFLLQGILPIMKTNIVLWSIHYEVVFYIWFLFIPKKQSLILYQILLFGALSLIVWNYPSIPQILGGYFAGFCFWLTGFYLSKINLKNVENYKFPLISLLLMALVMKRTAAGTIILNSIGLSNLKHDVVSLEDLFILPLCFLTVAEAANIKIHKNIKRGLYIAVFLIPGVILLGLLYKNRLLENMRWQIATFAYCFALVFLFFKQNQNVLKKLSFFGALSFSIYIIHFVVGYILGRYFNADNLFEKVILVFAWMVIVIFVSWVLEFKFQKSVKNYFLRFNKATNLSLL